MDEDVTPRAVRMKIAEHDLQLRQFAELAGVSYGNLSEVLHGNRALGPGMRARLARAMDRVDANPPPRRRKRGYGE
jgi:plasmid maintenance system antidote protein VapI